MPSLLARHQKPSAPREYRAGASASLLERHADAYGAGLWLGRSPRTCAAWDRWQVRRGRFPQSNRPWKAARMPPWTPAVPHRLPSPGHGSGQLAPPSPRADSPDGSAGPFEASPPPPPAKPTHRPRPDRIGAGRDPVIRILDISLVASGRRPGSRDAARRLPDRPLPMDVPEAGRLGWWAPVERRGVLHPADLHLTSWPAPAARFSITVDRAFAQVLRLRRLLDGEGGSRRSSPAAYEAAPARVGAQHRGLAPAGLAGGLCRVAIGGLFAGESMFHRDRRLRSPLPGWSTSSPSAPGGRDRRPVADRAPRHPGVTTHTREDVCRRPP